MPCPPPGDLPDSGIETASPAWQADTLPLSHLESPSIPVIFLQIAQYLTPWLPFSKWSLHMRQQSPGSKTFLTVVLLQSIYLELSNPIIHDHFKLCVFFSVWVDGLYLPWGKSMNVSKFQENYPEAPLSSRPRISHIAEIAHDTLPP